MKKFKLLLFFILCYNLIIAQIPNGYYNSAQGLSGTPLKAALNSIIDNHTAYPYSSSSTDVWDILQQTDEDPNNSLNVILLYSGRSEPKANRVGSSGATSTAWNREHVWAKSHGGFGTSTGAGTDAHHLRPSDESVNSNRGNLDFDNGGTPHPEATGCKYDSDSWEPRDEVKGDVARMIFYMATRYEGAGSDPDLEVNDLVNNLTNPYHGKLTTLVQWHYQDTVDNFERNRNNIIYSFQGNRNPYIDHPEYVTYIFDSTFTGLNIIKPEPTNHVTNFERLYNVKLNWQDQNTGVLPTNFLIVRSHLGFNQITNPVDGINYPDASNYLNVGFGIENVIFPNCNKNTMYYFKIFPYTNLNGTINYKTGNSVPQISFTTPNQ